MARSGGVSFLVGLVFTSKGFLSCLIHPLYAGWADLIHLFLQFMYFFNLLSSAFLIVVVSSCEPSIGLPAF